MSQQVRTILAVALSLGIFYLWYAWIAPPPKPQPTGPVPKETEPHGGGEGIGAREEQALPGRASLDVGGTGAAPPRKGGPQSSVKDPQAAVAEQRTVVTTDRMVVELSNLGGAPTAWALPRYRIAADGDRPVDVISPDAPAPLGLTGDLLEQRVPMEPHYTVEQPGPRTVVYRWRGNDLALTKTYQFHDDAYLVDVTVAVRNLGASPLEGRVGLGWHVVNPPQTTSGFLSFLRGPPNVWANLYYKDGSVTRKHLGSEPLTEQSEGRLSWGGVENRYYLAAILPRSQSAQGQVAITGRSEAAGGSALATYVAGGLLPLPPGAEKTEAFSIYVGPKRLEDLKAVGMHLTEAIDYGWFGFVALPILYLLKFFYGLVRNYGLAIICLTVFIKLLLHPITKASMRSMKKMQALQPRLKELREKYKNDRERLNVETMQLFRAHGVNPMGGCLPMVLQIPVYIALYKVLWNAVELYRAPFFGFYRDLSAPDPYFIAPLLLGLSFYFQQRLTPSPTMDPAQQKVMMLMPIMFTAFMVFLPSGLVIYILVNTLFSLLQQWLMNRGLGFRDLLRGRLAPRLV